MCENSARVLPLGAVATAAVAPLAGIPNVTYPLIAAAVDFTSIQPVSVLLPENPNIVATSSRRLAPPSSVRVTGLVLRSDASNSVPSARNAVIVRIAGDDE